MGSACFYCTRPATMDHANSPPLQFLNKSYRTKQGKKKKSINWYFYIFEILSDLGFIIFSFENDLFIINIKI